MEPTPSRGSRSPPSNYCVIPSSSLLEADEEQDDLSVEHDRRPQCVPGRGRFLIGALFCVAGIMCVSVSVIRFGDQHSLRTPVPEADDLLQKDIDIQVLTQCGPISQDVDFVYTSGKGFDHSPGPHDCCARCQDIASCKSWTWVKDVGKSCGSQCWVKTGDLKHNISKKGVVSGHQPNGAFPVTVAHSGMWCRPPVDGKFPVIWDYDAPGKVVDVKVMTYNLNWFTMWKGLGKGRANVIKHSGQQQPYDLLGFQECRDPDWIMTNAGFENEYHIFKGTHEVCMAVRKANWAVLGHGMKDVAEDSHLQYYGVRIAMWARLRHTPSGRTFFFLNHHGPTPVNSGGICGGAATAYNLLSVVTEFAQLGDAVILVGDFNADPTALTVKFLHQHLHTAAFNGEGAHGGIDNMFTNLPAPSVTQTAVLNAGGSDHNPLAAIFHVR